MPKNLKKNVKNFFSAFSLAVQRGLLHLAYPTKCLHCHTPLAPEPILLCSSCASLLDIIPLHSRCLACFNPLDDFASFCRECIQHPPLYAAMAAAFEYSGVAATLVKRLKYGNQPYLARGMAGFLAIQFDRLQWPLPDAIVPVPLSFTHWLERGYNQSTLLAEEFGRIFQRPVWKVLRRQSGDYSQAALTLKQRKALTGKTFRLKSKYSMGGKILLLIDDVMTSGSTLHRCADILMREHPAGLYALTFCRSS